MSSEPSKFKREPSQVPANPKEDPDTVQLVPPPQEEESAEREIQQPELLVAMEAHAGPMLHPEGIRRCASGNCKKSRRQLGTRNRVSQEHKQADRSSNSPQRSNLCIHNRDIGIGGQCVCNQIGIHLARFWRFPYNPSQCRVSDDLGAKIIIEQAVKSLVCP